MQDIAHLVVKGQKILVLRRSNFSYHVALKIRNSGKDGIFLQDESNYLETEPEALKELLDGKVIKL